MLSPEQMSDPQILFDRGWRKWSYETDKDGKVLFLCPLVDYKNVPNGTPFECVNGAKKIKGENYIDEDSRFGLLTYGLRV
jgi:hypothetical protein